jgi:hypothetical protein
VIGIDIGKNWAPPSAAVLLTLQEQRYSGHGGTHNCVPKAAMSRCSKRQNLRADQRN